MLPKAGYQLPRLHAQPTAALQLTQHHTTYASRHIRLRHENSRLKAADNDAMQPGSANSTGFKKPPHQQQQQTPAKQQQQQEVPAEQQQQQILDEQQQQQQQTPAEQQQQQILDEQQQQQQILDEQQQQQQQQILDEQQQQQQQILDEQQQLQQSELPPGYDPNAAAGFMPPPGQQPMWWVEKFEERRKQLARQQASSSSSSNGVQRAAATASSSMKAWLPKAAQQIVQLAIVNALLILWPAGLYPGGLAATQVWLLYWAYMLFFACGSVYRLVKFGPLAARREDVQGRKWWSTAAWLIFVISIPVIHWPPVGTFLKRQQQLAAAGKSSSVITLYDALGFGFLAAAVGLNWWAARHLGKAYDRVVTPETLVTDGPYAVVQHPIYTSYMLLFVGYGLTLHSWPTALLALAVCLVYYMSRTQLEKGVLRQAFGQQYEEYSRTTKLFVPFLL